MSTVSKKKKVKKLKKKKGIPAESRAYDNLESGNSLEEVDRLSNKSRSLLAKSNRGGERDPSPAPIVQQ